MATLPSWSRTVTSTCCTAPSAIDAVHVKRWPASSTSHGSGPQSTLALSVACAAMTCGQQPRAGRAVAVPAPPVRAAPPTLVELVARGTRVGLGVAGLARDALLVAVARTSPPAAPAAATGGRLATLVPGAAVGL